jgi:putative ABC transport system permease protein
MSWLATLRVALRALARNKLRSFLTGLGVVIGVAAVIAMVAIGDGAKARVEATFAAMGSNMLIVMNGSSGGGGAMGGFGSLPTLTWDDLKAVQTELTSVRYAAPVLRTNGQVLSEDLNWGTSVQGGTGTSPPASPSPSPTWTAGPRWRCWARRWSRSSSARTPTPSAR